MPPTQRLELTWIGKGEEPQLEPRILIEDPEKSYGEAGSDNMLVHGDNLLALKALEQEYAGKVKCIFIDPPYNTGNAFEQYDDGVEHSQWLNLIIPRLRILRTLMSDDGSIWIAIDAVECHYLKVLCDEMFGRSNFITMITWQRKYSVSNNFQGIATICDYILVYSKSENFQNNLLPRTAESIKRYSNPDNDPRGPWKAVDYLNQASVSKRPNLVYDIVNPNSGEIIKNRDKAWKYDPNTHTIHVEENKIWWGVSGTNSVPALKLFLSEVRDGMTPHNWWPHSDAGHTDEAKKESKAIFGGIDVFATPKPERLLERILTLATNKNDLVLDSFLGSGTTAAVAHKMGRRWIGIELGEHANTHCLPRLKKVVDGLDEGGISKAQNWKGGGGFKFYNLAPSLLRKDDLGQWVIDERYNADQLAAAMAKHEGYTYAPDTDRYWKQAYSTENDYLYTTTQLITPAVVDHILEQLGPEESLLICCKAYQKGAAARDPRINLHKIPSILTDRCEFGKDDYSLNIVDAPKDEDAPEFVPAGQVAARAAEAEEFRKYGKQKDMFD
jgi:adenine-specific DNA-methyltransferase